jgi:hypothetical protein
MADVEILISGGKLQLHENPISGVTQMMKSEKQPTKD